MITRQLHDRRRVTRTSIYSGGLLFFDSRQSVRGFRVIDISNYGIKIRTHRNAILPVPFNITYDNFVTMRRCRLVWRWSELIGAVFVD